MMVLEVNNMAQPIHKVKAGQVSSAVWPNEATVNGKKMTMLKATVERRYRDSEGNWKSSGSFGRNEIPLAIYCMQKALEYIIEKDNARSENGVGEETVA